jgi:chemotaxis protein CheC
MNKNNNSKKNQEVAILHTVARLGIQHAMRGLSEMVGEELDTTEPELFSVPILKIPEFFGGAEQEAVGIYLRASGEASGQFMMILTFEKALAFVDMLMQEPPGTTQELDDMGRSALAEMGNLTGAFFLNAVANLTGLEARPSEPAVMHDMVGAILNIIVAATAEQLDEVFVIQTTIIHKDHHVQANYWYIPDEKTMQLLIEKYNN